MKGSFLLLVILAAFPAFSWSQGDAQNGAVRSSASAEEIVDAFRSEVSQVPKPGFRTRGISAKKPEAKLTRRGFSIRGPKPTLEAPAGNLDRQGASNGQMSARFDFPMEEQEVEVTSKEVVFHNILFQRDSTDFADEASRLQVDQLAKALLQMPDQRFLIEGHTCDLGSEAHNLQLSYLRARAVQNHLLELGVQPDQVTILGFGEQELLENADPDATPKVQETVRSRNRRVVVRERIL